MTQDEIIEMAKQADWPDSLIAPVIMAKLNDFAKLVAQQAQAEERDACAKVAEWEPCMTDTPHKIASAIRARGQVS